MFVSGREVIGVSERVGIGLYKIRHLQIQIIVFRTVCCSHHRYFYLGLVRSG